MIDNFWDFSNRVKEDVCITESSENSEWLGGVWGNTLYITEFLAEESSDYGYLYCSWFMGSVIGAIWTHYLYFLHPVMKREVKPLDTPCSMIFHNSLLSCQEGLLNFDSKFWRMSILLNLDHQIYEQRNFCTQKTVLAFRDKHIVVFLTSTVVLTAKLVRLPICTDRCCYLEGRYEISADTDADILSTGVYCYKI
jgi:hypothetical protein